MTAKFTCLEKELSVSVKNIGSYLLVQTLYDTTFPDSAYHTKVSLKDGDELDITMQGTIKQTRICLGRKGHGDALLLLEDELKKKLLSGKDKDLRLFHFQWIGH